MNLSELLQNTAAVATILGIDVSRIVEWASDQWRAAPSGDREPKIGAILHVYGFIAAFSTELSVWKHLHDRAQSLFEGSQQLVSVIEDARNNVESFNLPRFEQVYRRAGFQDLRRDFSSIVLEHWRSRLKRMPAAREDLDTLLPGAGNADPTNPIQERARRLLDERRSAIWTVVKLANAFETLDKTVGSPKYKEKILSGYTLTFDISDALRASDRVFIQYLDLQEHLVSASKGL